METTYRHLSDDDAITHAIAKFNGEEPKQESPLTPETCPICSTILEPDARACSRCGAVFTPDAQSAKDQIEADVKRDYRETDPEDTDTMDKLDALDEVLEDPEVKALLLEKLNAD